MAINHLNNMDAFTPFSIYLKSFGQFIKASHVVNNFMTAFIFYLNHWLIICIPFVKFSF